MIVSLKITALMYEYKCHELLTFSTNTFILIIFFPISRLSSHKIKPYSQTLCAKQQHNNSALTHLPTLKKGTL